MKGGHGPHHPWQHHDHAELARAHHAWMTAHRRRHAIRRPLRRQIFWQFGGAIVGTALLAGGLSWLGRHFGLWTPRPAVFLAVFALLLWGVAGRLARRLTRPLEELARVADAIGAGDRQARVRLRHGDGSEAAVMARTLDDLAVRVDGQLRAGRELLARVSHELRTPLGHLRILQERAEDADDPRPALAKMRRELDEMERLVGELLASSRLDLVELERRAHDPRALAVAALERRGLDPSLLVDDPEVGATIAVDATLLGRALANGLDNAERHGGGVVALRLESAGSGAVRFVVEDAGPGLPEASREAAFAAFSGHGEASSLGLGLALVRRIARAHGGDATLQERPGGGLRLSIEIAALSSQTLDTAATGR